MRKATIKLIDKSAKSLMKRFCGFVYKIKKGILYKKMEKKFKYYNGQKLAEHDSKIKIILSGRAGGKSYWLRRYIITKCLQNITNCNDIEICTSQFLFLRRRKSEITIQRVKNYFEDLYSEIFHMSNGRFNDIKINKHTICLCSKTECIQIGQYDALENVSEMYGMDCAQIQDVIFEEFITHSTYLSNEIVTYQHVLSSIARLRNPTIWLIGNTVSRVCPYFKFFGLKIDKKIRYGLFEYEFDGQKIGIDIFKSENQLSEVSNIGKTEWESISSPNFFVDSQKIQVLPNFPKIFLENNDERIVILTCRYNGTIINYSINGQNYSFDDSIDYLITDNSKIEKHSNIRNRLRGKTASECTFFNFVKNAPENLASQNEQIYNETLQILCKYS